MLFQYSSSPAGAFATPFSTLTLDLARTEDELLQGLNRDTKYKVRRAEGKDQVVCLMEPNSDEALCRRFQAFYDEFATGKGVSRIGAEELLARGRAGTIRFSRADWGGQTVVWHVHALTTERATLLYSASHFRQLDDNETRATIGRANRLLHWKDILAFKAAGLKVYDFGGWYAGQDDEALLRINQFKEGFGGVRVDQVNAAMALTWRGWLYLRLRSLLSPQQRKALQLKLQSWRSR
ncbi:MAG: hypothetical protein ACKVQR_19780 [Aquabacterium sp.]